MSTDRCDAPAGLVQSKKHEFPWIIKLGTTKKDIISSDYQGSIISPNFIITTAYGVLDKHKTKLFCIVGINNINEYAAGNEGMKLRVKEVIIHEKYKESATGIRNNIALIKLAQPLNLGKTDVDAIKLPTPGSDYNGKTAVVAGWGMNRLLNYRNGKLMKKKLRLASNKKCKIFSERGTFEKNSLLCVNMKAEPPCYGDIGGPLMVKNQDGKYELAGIVSFGTISDTCICEGKTNMDGFYYVNVEHYIDWIRKNTEGEIYLWGTITASDKKVSEKINRLYDGSKKKHKNGKINIKIYKKLDVGWQKGYKGRQCKTIHLTNPIVQHNNWNALIYINRRPL